MKPNFRVGSFTTAYMTNEARLGSLAALATYMNDDEQQGGKLQVLIYNCFSILLNRNIVYIFH